MDLYTYRFTDLLKFNSPILEMWLTPEELGRFAVLVAGDMATSQPNMIGMGVCVAFYDVEGTVVSMVPLDTVH